MSHLPRSPLSFATFQALDKRGFEALLGPVVEHSAWVAANTWRVRPFKSWEALFHAMVNTLLGADKERQLALLRAHPELAGQEAQAGTMTPESQSEQGRLGMHRLTPEAFQRLTSLNQRYQVRFGFPFIAALRLHASLDSVLADLAARLCNDADTERALALGQVIQVMRGRLATTVSPDIATASPTSPTSQSTLA